MGDRGAITAIIAGIVALTALPALLIVLGDRVNALAPSRLAPSRGHHRARLLVPPVATSSCAARSSSRSRPRRCSSLAGLPFLRIEFTGVDASVLPDGSSAKVVDTALRTEFPPGPTSPLHVAVDGAALERRRGRGLRAAARRGSTAWPRPTRPRYVGERTWLVQVTPADAGARRSRRSISSSAVRAGPAPGPVAVAGESARFVDQRAEPRRTACRSRSRCSRSRRS